MAVMWGSAQQNGAGDALRGAANSEVNAALTQEVEAWLNNIGGKARVTADVGIGGSDSRDFGLDYLWPVKIWQHDILFTQMSAHRWNERDILNVGLGWRHTFNPHLMAGGNLFFDQDVTRHHNRMGAGAELWSDGIRASANYYLPLSGWRHSDDSMFNDDPDRYELYERAARGWDLNLETALSQHVALKLGWFQWYGDKVDVNGSRSEASHNPHGLNLGLKWQPVPLVGVSAEQSMISGQRDNFSVGLNFHWEFGRKLSEMLASENAAALPSLMQSRTEFVTRNNNIVLAYKQEEKDRRLYFSPTEKTTQAGVPLLHAVKGGQGGVIRYTSSSTAIATVEPGSGLVNPTHRGDVTITATETSPVDPEHVLSSASYHLTVTPGDFAPSVEGVAIKGDMSPGQILEGSYLYKSNEGEDEDPEQTRMRWYDADSGETLKEGSATYEVQTRDMARSVVFEVTPFNKKGIAGNSGSANVNGSAKLGALHVGLMTPGEVRPDGSVKFYVQSNGALQLLTEVKNDKEEAVEGLTVYWTSQNALGHLSQHVTHTDPKGQTSVSVEEIMSSGQDQITASLSPLVAGYSGNVTEDNGRYSHMKLNVNFAKADRLTFIQPPEHAMVGAAQPFTVKLTDQDGEDFKTSVDIAWQSNGQPIDQLSHTNDRGEASITLTAPTLVGTDWEVTATVEGGNPVTVKIPMVADVATAKVSALEVIDNNAAADGTDTTRVMVTVKDAHENPVAGQAVNFRAGEGIILPATATTEEDGTVTVSQTSLKAGEFRVEATTGDNWTQAKSGLVTFTADSSTAKVSALEVIDNSAAADGTDTTRVRVTVKDAHENPVAGQAVNFRAGEGIILPATATTEKDGTVTVSQTSLKAGEFRVEATTGDNWTQAKSGLVTFTADSSTAKVSALEVIDNSAAADGTDATRVRVTVKDAHENPVAGQVVNFRAGEGVILPATATTEKDGTVTVSQTSLKAGEFRVEATTGDSWTQAKSGLVTFTADSSTAKVSALEVIDNNAAADGTDATRVRVTVKDAHENPVAGQAVNFRSGEGVVLPATATTEKDGTVTVSQTSLKAGEFWVEATTGDNWTQAKSGLVTFTADSSTAKVSALEVIDNNAVADGTDTTRVRVTVKDAHENPVVGQVVSFDAGTGVIIPATAETGKDGTVTVSQTSLKAGEFQVNATIGDNWLHAKSVLVTFTADSSTAKVSALEVIDNNAVADGTDTTRVRVTVKDAHENPVAGQVVNFRAGEGVILPATAETGKDGTVTVSQTSLKAGEFRVEATTGDNWTQAKSGLVTFTADSSTAKVSALEVIDNNAVADGTDTTRVRVTVKDAHENPVAGQVVNFRAGEGVILPATATTEKDGTVTVSQTSQKAGEFQVNATIGDNWLHAKSVLVNFVPGKVNRVTFVDEPESVQADGVTHATWQIAMFDSFNNPVPNTAVNWIFPGALATKIDSQSDTMTNNSGVAKLTLQMGTVKAENLVVTAKSENNVEDSSSIALPPVAGSVELTMASTARVDEPVTLTVTAKDKGGVLMPGAVVTFSSNHPDWMVITPESATTGSNGVATAVATIRPEKGFGAMGGYTLTAKVSESVKDSKTLQLSVGQIDYAKSSLTPVSDTMVVGNQLSMLIAMKDKFGNPVSGLTGRIGAVLADSQGRNNGGLIHTNSGGIVETEKGNYPFNVKGTRADTYTVTPVVDRVELSALKATVKVMAQKPWIAGTPQIGYTLTIGKGSGFSTATVNWKVNGTIYRSSANTTVDSASLELTDTTLINQKVSVEIIDSHNPSVRLESDSVTIRGTPSASDVKIKGDPVYGNQISVDYVYQANGGGDESGTQYQWYWSQNSYDKSPTPIPGATGRTLKTDRGQYGLYLYVSVTPRGSAGGSGAKVFNDGYFRVTDAGTPSVSQLHIENEARVGNTIEASYIFNANGSGEDNSLYQWASWDEFSGRYRNLDGETGKTLYIKEAYGFLKDIRVSVTPRGTLGSQRTGGTAYSDPVNIVK
ncbi:Ig-like domain-containing protein [Enterobacter bugandensis]|uniref:Ig-like domain-containing protein n=5 Tax=Enterobacter bugandensis TaxID=881260 RepID=UPI00283A91CC|nr:Ig-like domain-containing protein [Enterobacter bugandensis]WMU43500.1 Ig-like domain-containing protein [Enterobacter bugandensis]